AAKRRPGAGGESTLRAGARAAARSPPPASHRPLRPDQEGVLPEGHRGAADAAPERADAADAAPAHLPPEAAHRPLQPEHRPRDAGEEQDRQPRGVPGTVELGALGGEGGSPLPDRGPRPRSAGRAGHGPEERGAVLPSHRDVPAPGAEPGTLGGNPALGARPSAEAG